MLQLIRGRPVKIGPEPRFCDHILEIGGGFLLCVWERKKVQFPYLSTPSLWAVYRRVLSGKNIKAVQDWHFLFPAFQKS